MKPQFDPVSRLSAQNLTLVNELLPTAPPMGAYALGLICSLAARDGVIAPDSLLRAAVSRQSIRDAVALYETCADFMAGERLPG